MYRTYCRHITHRVGTLATTSSQVACMENIFWWNLTTYVHTYSIQCMYIPSSEVMQLSTGQSLTRWVGLLLLPMATVNSYSVHGCRPPITYESLLALDRVVPISLFPEPVFCKILTISITCPLVRDVYRGKLVYQLQSFVCTVIWVGGFVPNCLLTSHIILKLELLTGSHTPHTRPVEIEKFTIMTQLILVFITVCTNNYAHIPHRSGIVFIHSSGVCRGRVGTQLVTVGEQPHILRRNSFQVIYIMWFFN